MEDKGAVAVNGLVWRPVWAQEERGFLRGGGAGSFKEAPPAFREAMTGGLNCRKVVGRTVFHFFHSLGMLGGEFSSVRSCC